MTRTLPPDLTRVLVTHVLLQGPFGQVVGSSGPHPHRAEAFLTRAKTTSLSVSQGKPDPDRQADARTFCRRSECTKSLMPQGVQNTAGVGVRGPRPRAKSSLSGPVDLGPHNNVASRSKSTHTVANATNASATLLSPTLPRNALDRHTISHNH